MKKTTKLMALVLACAMMLGLTACGGSGNTAGSTSAAGSTPAQTEPAASATASDKT